MGGVAGEQDGLSERVYYSQCMWRGGVTVPSVQPYCWKSDSFYRETHAQNTWCIDKSQTGNDSGEPHTARDVLFESYDSLSLSCVEAGPGCLMVDMLGLFSQVWKLKDVSAQYTPF